MYIQSNHKHKYDWVIFVLYLALISFGFINIASASHVGEITNYFDTSEFYGKHLIFVGISFVLIIVIMSLDSKFFERFASIIYVGALIALLGLFIFGKNVNGAKSWYAIGSMTLQPSEFAKFATTLAIAKYLSDIQTNIKTFKDQLRAGIIIFIPAALILLQNDAGSTIVYLSFFFVLVREGLQKVYILLILSAVILSVLSLKFSFIYTGIIITIILTIAYVFGRKKRNAILIYLGILIACLGFSKSVTFFFDYGLKPHQQNRISIWLRLEDDPAILEKIKRNQAYNLIQSEEAISSGGLTGKGFLQGTRTTGKFVPEQRTDYIFSTIGEEWGFIGSVSVIIVFVLLLCRILYRAEQQKNQFSRIYGYGVASIIFIHFTLNTGMVMGLIPTIGIPLPFFSYGGSSLLGFTILLFIFVKLDSNRVNEW